MTLEESQTVLDTLRVAYPRQKLAAGTAELWAAALGDQDLRDVRLAVADWIQTQRWWPTIAEVRERARESRRARMAAEDAGRVLKALPANGSRTPQQEARARVFRALTRQFLAGELTLEQFRAGVDRMAPPA